MSDAEALLTWMIERGGTATSRDFGDTAPRQFRRAAVYGPLVDDLLASGAIVETCTRPRTFEVVEKPKAPASTSTGARILAMLDEAAAEAGDMPDGLVAYLAAISVRDRLVERIRERNGVPESDFYARATQAVDEAVAKAFGCKMNHHQHGLG